MNTSIYSKIKTRTKKNKISCRASHEISKMNKLTPHIVGTNINELKIKIIKCQLNLFGYDKEDKKIKPAKTVSSELKSLILNNENKNKLSCNSAWNIASKLRLDKTNVSDACEAMGIKISMCQLGAFK